MSFPLAFAFPLPTDDLSPQPTMSITHITNLADIAAANTLRQYRTKPLFMALVAAIQAQAQQVEDALWGMVAMLDYTQAIGVWLDYLGAIVGEPRDGLSSDRSGGLYLSYQPFIEARILANASSGDLEDILSVLRAAAGVSPGAGYNVDDFPPMALTIQFPSGVSPTTGPVIAKLARLAGVARSAAVNLQLIYDSDISAPNLFQLSDTSMGGVTGLGLDDANNPGTVGGQLIGVAQT